MPRFPIITIAVPSFNQGQFIDAALASIFGQDLEVEVFVADGGSVDGTLDVVGHWEHRLAGWRSRPDSGQAAAINECIARGTAPYVAWLNSDDLYAPGGLQCLLEAIEAHPTWSMAYGRAHNVDALGRRVGEVWTQPFSERRLAIRNIVSQPATVIRRSAWEAVGGVDETLHLAMDYDLWWRLHRQAGPLGYVRTVAAFNREHDQTKTNSRRAQHYGEAVTVVRRHLGRVPLKWWLAWPYAVWIRSWLSPQRQ